MRLFVAVYPPAEAIEHLAATVERLEVACAAQRGINARLAVHDLWHVTLAFIGDVPDQSVQAAATALDQALSTVEQPPVLRIAGGGRFGRGRFTILWTGLDGDVANLRTLTRTLRVQLRRVRIPFDDKPLRPHLTLARPGDRLPEEALRADLAVLGEYQGPQWTMRSVRLVRSYPGPRPWYETLHTATFAE